MRLLTAAEIAAFLGISASGVRHIVRRHQIKPRAKDGRAKLYDPSEVLRHASTLDRVRLPQTLTDVTIGVSDRMPSNEEPGRSTASGGSSR